MALERKDAVGDQTATTGTGTLTLTGVAPTGHRAFSGNVTTGSTVRVRIQDASNTEWEVSEGVWTSGGATLTRVTVYASSNAGALVSFAAGTKDVLMVPTAQDLDEAVTGQTSSVDSEIALFSGIGGKTIKRASTTGLLKAASGVIGAAVSGTDIKTVNSTTLLGSGDLAVGDVTTTGTQTLSNKTLTGTKETVYAIVDGVAPDIDPANGGIQTWTLGAGRTPTATNFSAGQSVCLMIADGTAYAVTWTTIGVTWVGGTAPALPTSGYGVIELWKVGSTVYGASVGDVA